MSALRDRLARLLAEAPGDAPAIEFDGRWWHWDDVRATATDIGDALDDAGLGPGSRVGLVLENRPEHVAAVLAVLATGRCVVTLSPLQPATRLAADVTAAALPVVLASPDALVCEGVAAAVGDTGVAVTLGSDGSVARTGGAPDQTTGDRPRTPTAVEMLTSGTTGPPKRVHLDDGQLDRSLGSSGQLPRDGRLLSSSAALVSTPMVHIGGFWAALSCLAAGRRMILVPKFSVETWVDAVERHGLRVAGLVPAAIRSVLDADIDPARLATLQVVTSGTAACPSELADAFFRRFGVRVLMTYGATEFAGAVAGWTKPLHEQWWSTKAGSAGRAFPGVTLRIVDAAELGVDEVGHLEVLSAQVGDGWTRTADLARIDADGFLWITGRADDAIIRGGFKIAPETVRRALEDHPAVREAAVAGLAEPRLGAVPVAAVELEPGATAPSPAALVAHCRTLLTPYETPVHVAVLDALPRTPSSKVSQVDLLAAVRAAMDPARRGASA